MVRSQEVMGMDVELTIGRLADEAGVNVETIRYYQRSGLLVAPGKPHSGYRRYPSSAAKRVRFIKRAQALGFTLEEISGLLELDEVVDCAATRELAENKLQLIERKLAELTAMRKVLAKLTRECGAQGGPAACPIIHALAAD